jgi:hypothetical protein
MNLPSDFTLWVDPLEVVCRYGPNFKPHFLDPQVLVFITDKKSSGPL